MKSAPYLTVIFLVVCLAQWLVPASMILEQERTLRTGDQLKFRTQPVDPYDAFRGRYVALRLDPDHAPAPPELELDRGERVFASVEEAEDGFARFTGVSRTRPAHRRYLEVRVRSVYQGKVHLHLPFDRYYMEENLAPAADRAYRRHSRRQQHDAYVVIRCRDGHGVIEELYVGGQPIREFVREEGE